MTDADAPIDGRYRLERILASGGTGVVWEGRDDQLQRRVAVKQVYVRPLSQSEHAVVVARLMREARAVARVHHPNVVQVVDVVEAAGRPCLIMEFVPSRSLYEVVTAQGPLVPAAVARIGTQLAAGLAAAHRAGIVHRDVRPSNMLLREDGTAKVTDFGLSRALEDSIPTSPGMPTGRSAYVAPELAHGAPANFASDVYSLGATLSMAFTGRPPIGQEENPMTLLDRAASGPLAPPARTDALTALLAAMMSSDPAERPGMVDVANALSALQPGLQDSPTHETSASAATEVIALPRPAPEANWLLPPSPPPRSAETRPDSQRRRIWPPIVAALLVIALGTALGVALLNGAGTDHEAASDTSVEPSVPASTPTTPSSSPPSSTPTSGRPSTSVQVRPRSKPTPRAAQLENAVVTYFHLVPGNLNAGWSRLTPHFRRTKARSRQAYDDYWHSVKRVDVRAARGLPPNRATATLTYHYKNGRVVTQHTQFKFVPRDGTLKIDSESYPS